MRNPFRSEADAFRFVWLTIGYFALIVIGVGDQHVVGVAVFVVAHGRRRSGGSSAAHRAEPPVRQAPAAHPPEEHRILVVANETVGGARAARDDPRADRQGANARVLVVCPALNSPLRHWVSDEDDARATAQERLDASLAAMRAAGIEATGEIGDGDPIQAIEDALRTFRPDELIISTHPPGRSHWLERGVVEKARERFDAAGHPRRRRSEPLTDEIEQVDPLPLRAELRDVHRSALGAGALSDEWARERLPGTRGRDGFVFLAARDGGVLVGFGYGYTGRVRPLVDRPRRARRSRRAARASGSTRRTSRSSSCTCGPRISARASAAAARAAADAAAARPRAPLDAGRLPQGARLLREERVAGACRGRFRSGVPALLRPRQATGCSARLSDLNGV